VSSSLLLNGSWGQSSRGMRLNTNLHPPATFRMSGAISPPPIHLHVICRENLTFAFSCYSPITVDLHN
jgi:hypothetical protein